MVLLNSRNLQEWECQVEKVAPLCRKPGRWVNIRHAAICGYYFAVFYVCQIVLCLRWRLTLIRVTVINACVLPTGSIYMDPRKRILSKAIRLDVFIIHTLRYYGQRRALIRNGWMIGSPAGWLSGEQQKIIRYNGVAMFHLGFQQNGFLQHSRYRGAPTAPSASMVPDIRKF